VAGLFDTSGTEGVISGLVPAADWLQVRIMMPGGPLVHHPGDVSSHRMTLDLRRGALLSASRLKTPELGILGLRTLRLVSLSERAVGLQLIQMEIEKGEI
jgi:trehalose/maltose hydrolase-like predicted phosphorylase